jgi:NADPH:quinone reductase-like Zn-dependent oxidoreductase
MKAIAIDGYGDPDKLQLVDMDSPPIAPDQVLVQVRAAGVNPIDWRLCNGSMQNFSPVNFRPFSAVKWPAR